MTRSVTVAILLFVSACGGGTAPPGVTVDPGGGAAGEVLRFYLGAYMPSAAVDSVLLRDGDDFRIDMRRLSTAAPGFHAELAAATADGLIDRGELQQAVRRSYFAARDLPGTVGALREQAGLGEAGRWMVLRVRGSMTPYERRIHVPVDAVMQAIRSFVGAGGRLVYPVGTTIVGEHIDDGSVVETTAMIRRDDGFWDYAAYGSDGRLVDRIHGDPDPLAVPTQCFGCHYGTRLFEPERSFPARPSDGPHGPRLIDVPPAWIAPEAVSLFDEHRRRDDGILGPYATLLAGSWLAASGSDSLSAEAAHLLDALGL